MSIRVMTWVLDEAPTSDVYEVLVLLTLADHANDDGTGCWPSMRKIALRARCSERKARYVLRDLERKGMICGGDQRLTQHHRPDRRPTVYNLVLPRGAQRAGRDESGGHDGPERGAQQGVNGGHSHAPEPSFEPSITVRVNRGAATCSHHFLPEPCRGCADDRLSAE